MPGFVKREITFTHSFLLAVAEMAAALGDAVCAHKEFRTWWKEHNNLRCDYFSGMVGLYSFLAQLAMDAEARRDREQKRWGDDLDFYITVDAMAARLLQPDGHLLTTEALIEAGFAEGERFAHG